MGFSTDRLFTVLQEHSLSHCYRIAYSGGLDSHVLLYSLVQLRSQLPNATLTAVHVDHGLSPRSEQWSHHCREVCTALGIFCQVIKTDARPAKGESPEAVAREARYRILCSLIGVGECLLTAQHQDDQAETVLLQLLRGAGPSGLAAMARTAPFGEGRLLRPLLPFSRAELKAYAEKEGLTWIEDPSNLDIRFDRNYVRHAVLPVLQQRWPSVARTLARVAAHQADTAELLDKQAQTQLAKIDHGGQELPVGALRELPLPDCRNLLRYWLKRQGLPLPDRTHLQRIIEEVLPAGEDSQPLVAWPGAEVRRYRQRLYALQPLPPHDSMLVLAWNGVDPLLLPPGVGGVLRLKPTTGWGLNPAQLRRAPLTVRFRQGGEYFHPITRGRGCSLKKLFQEYGIPPWRRARIPLIYSGDRLAFVCEIGAERSFAAPPQHPGAVIDWRL
jgi:tRNA(Ile)-lysidine synthase